MENKCEEYKIQVEKLAETLEILENQQPAVQSPRSPMEFDYEFIPDLTPSEIDQSSPNKSLKASKIEK
jgi:hypothetical protein